MAERLVYSGARACSLRRTIHCVSLQSTPNAGLRQGQKQSLPICNGFSLRLSSSTSANSFSSCPSSSKAAEICWLSSEASILCSNEREVDYLAEREDCVAGKKVQMMALVCPQKNSRWRRRNAARWSLEFDYIRTVLWVLARRNDGPIEVTPMQVVVMVTSISWFRQKRHKELSMEPYIGFEATSPASMVKHSPMI